MCNDITLAGGRYCQLHLTAALTETPVVMAVAYITAVVDGAQQKLFGTWWANQGWVPDQLGDNIC